MINTYQQAKNKTLDINPKKIQSELKYNRMDVFRACKIGYLVLGGLLLIFTFIAQFGSGKTLDKNTDLDIGYSGSDRFSLSHVWHGYAVVHRWIRSLEQLL